MELKTIPAGEFEAFEAREWKSGSKKDFRVGDRELLCAEAEWPRDVQLVLRSGEAALSDVGLMVMREKSGCIEIAYVKPGEIRIPELGVAIGSGGFRFPSLQRNIESAFGSKSEAPTPMPPLNPLAIPFPVQTMIWTGLGILIILVGVTIFGRRFWVKRRENQIIPQKKVDQSLTPDAWALQTLEQLFLHEKRTKRIIQGVSRISKTYLSKRFGLNAEEWTISEIREALGQYCDQALSDGFQLRRAFDRLLQLLEDCDRIVFAKREVQPEEITALKEALRTFVVDTRARSTEAIHV